MGNKMQNLHECLRQSLRFPRDVVLGRLCATSSQSSGRTKHSSSLAEAVRFEAQSCIYNNSEIDPTTNYDKNDLPRKQVVKLLMVLTLQFLSHDQGQITKELQQFVVSGSPMRAPEEGL
ncbi:acyl-coenzyme A synthetase ACSM1, mitochondrial-like [Pan troglodytes]|uniref:acyl-coenzyme A synthetase ACSM1, mitochondrial-like n=1 Tax=Pan troglodytes TaxID=9598 RepID=UPI003013F5A4